MTQKVPKRAVRRKPVKKANYKPVKRDEQSPDLTTENIEKNPLKRRRVKIVAGSGLGFLLLLFLISLFFFWPNTNFRLEKFDVVIPSGATEDQIITYLDTNKALSQTWTFHVAAAFTNIAPKDSGLIEIENGWGNAEIIKALNKKPLPAVDCQVRNYRFRRNTVRRFCKPLDIKYTALQRVLEDSVWLSQYPEYDKDNIYTVFVPDTFPVYTHARAEEIADRLVRKAELFWTKEMRAKAAEHGLTPQEAYTLASIVHAEVKHKDEMPKIAGLYQNRLRDSIRLQADPTVVYAIGQRNVRRVKRWHTRVKNPYNTYRYDGLPPGPVFVPSREAIEAVLNPEKHDYIYFVARSDFSGYHDFSKTYEEHKKKAKKYRNALNRRKIR